MSPPVRLPTSQEEMRTLQGDQRAQAAKRNIVPGAYNPLTDYEPFKKKPSETADNFKRSFGFWFNALWSEAVKTVGRGSPKLKVAGRDADNDLMMEVAKKVFAHEMEGKYARALTKADQLSAVEKRMYLSWLFEIGYEPFPNKYSLNAGALLADSLDTADDEASVHLAFRCDSRPKETIKAQSGAKCRADQQSNLDSMGFFEDWNPFRDKAVRQQLFYRRGSADNDLNTVVSIASSFEAAGGFPLIDDYRLRHPNSSDFFTVTEQPVAGNRFAKTRSASYKTDVWNQAWDEMQQRNQEAVSKGNLGLCYATVSGKVETHLAMRCSVYVVKVQGRVYDTRGHQADDKTEVFPEAAVREVPWENYLAVVPVRRLHEGSRKADGYSLYPEKPEVLHDEKSMELILGNKQAVASFKLKVQQILQSVNNFKSATTVKVPVNQIVWPKSFGPYQAPVFS